MKKTFSEKLKETFIIEDKEKKKYNYIKEPLSKNGIVAFVTGIIVFAATIALLGISIYKNGDVGVELASIGMSAILLSLTGLIFVFIAAGEKNKKRVLAWIGGVLCFLTAVIWTALLAF